jgi:peptidyl-prolyl cis-trans isomerase C
MSDSQCAQSMRSQVKGILPVKSRLVLASVLPLLMLMGCEKEPVGQVVAVVNGEEITQQELNAEIQQANVPATVDKQEVAKQALDRIVTRRLLTQLAKNEDLDRNPEFTIMQRRVNDEMLVGFMAQQQAKNIPLPAAAEVNAYLRDHPTMFSSRKRYNVQRITFPMTVDRGVIARLGPAHSLDAVAAILSAANVQYVRSPGALDSAGLPANVVERIDDLPDGEPFVLPAENTWTVNVVTSTESIEVSAEDARNAAIELMRREAVQKQMQDKLNQAREGAEIKYNEAFAPSETKGAEAAPKGAPAPSKQGAAN